MIVVWQIYWPLLLAALLTGVIVGRLAYRMPKISDEAKPEIQTSILDRYRQKRNRTVLVGLGALLAAVALWHGPLGGGDRFARQVERIVAGELEWLEVPAVTGRLDRAPLSRTLVLTGPANSFQQDGFRRALRPVKGLSDVRWDNQPSGFALPLLAEVTLLSLVAFGLGLFFSFIVEIRRRVNADWSW